MSLSPRKASCFLVTGGVLLASEREQRPRFSSGDLILYLPILWAPLSFPYSICLTSLFSSFFFLLLPQSFPPSEGRGADILSIRISSFLLSFSLHWPLPMLVWRNHLSSFMFCLPPTWLPGKTSSWKIWKLHSLHLWICGNTLFTLFSYSS